jgi:prepilin-type N-terminal cleavage/methylation domain-containing protein
MIFKLAGLQSASLLTIRARQKACQGLTLIECLVAILMVALLASAIAPALAVAVATRVQSQKSEQALQLAQAEVDRVRRLTEEGFAGQKPGESAAAFQARKQAYLAKFPPRVATLNNNVAKNQPAPGTQVVSMPTNLTPTNTLGVKLNPAEPGATPTTNCVSDGSCDFAVQIYRTRGYPDNATDAPSAFGMGVRVYDYRAVTSGATLSTDPASLALSGGDGGRSRKPLAVLYTTIATGEKSNSLCDLITYTGGSSTSRPLGCPPLTP